MVIEIRFKMIIELIAFNIPQSKERHEPLYNKWDLDEQVYLQKDIENQITAQDRIGC